jgi:hypothetical protein
MLVLALNIRPGITDPGTIYVPANYTTIQAAINAASPGSTIMVAAGSYDAEVIINKALTILGAGAGKTFINGTGVTPIGAGLVTITAAGNVTFSGFTVENAPLDSNLNEFEIFSSSSVSGVTYKITNNSIVGTGDTNPADFEVGYYSQDDAANVIFEYNNITSIGDNNIVFEVHIGATEISHNNLGAGIAGGDSIFFMTYNNEDVSTLQNISYNEIDMGRGTIFNYTYRSTGISICAPGPAYGTTDAKCTDVTIEGNTIYNLKSNRRGIGFWIGGNGTDIIQPTVIGNTITGLGCPGNSSGIDFVGSGDVAGANITLNTISGTADGIILRSGNASAATINYNYVFGNTVGLNWTSETAIDASYNWWGNASGPINPSNPTGTGNPVIGNASFQPWLISQSPALLYINPPAVTYRTLSYGQNFTLKVNIGNITNLFGFDIQLYWNTTLLYLAGVQVTLPWSTSWTLTNNINQTLGRYQLVSTALGLNTLSFSGSTTVAKLTFKIILDPICPANGTCKIRFGTLSALSDPNGKPIYHLVQDGQYTIYSTTPQIIVAPAAFSADALNQIFTVNINVSNVVNLSWFSIQLDFNATLLQAVSDPKVGTFLISPKTQGTGYDNAHGHVVLNASSGIGAPPSNGSGILESITFEVIKATLWRTYNSNILTCALHLHNTILETDTGIQIGHVNVDGTYHYVPIPGDLNYDGKVDLTDLHILGYWYNTYNKCPANCVADINGDGYVNILDLTILARHYGAGC